MAIDTQTNPATLTAGLQIVADEVIKALQPYALALDGFARNFSKKVSAEANGGIYVPFVEADEVADYNASSNNFGTEGATANKGCLVKLGAHKIVKFTITPEQVAEFDPTWWQGKADMNVRAIVNSIFTAICGVANSSKVTNTYELPATLDIGGIVDLAKEAHAKNINVENATLYLKGADYFDFLKAMDYKTTGETILLNGSLAGVTVGFKAIACLPSTATASFVATPDYVCVAARPYTDGLGAGGDILEEAIFDDATVKLPLVQTLVRKAATKTLVHNLDCWFGAELGNKAAGIKLTRATA